MPFSDRVIVVLSEDPGPKLESLAESWPVWAVRTPASEAVARRLWAIEPRPDPRERGLTLFPALEDVEESFLSVFDEVELRHGPDSGAPRIQSLVVLGGVVTASVSDALESAGFDGARQTDAGFLAYRGADPWDPRAPAPES